MRDSYGCEVSKRGSPPHASRPPLNCLNPLSLCGGERSTVRTIVDRVGKTYCCFRSKKYEQKKYTRMYVMTSLNQGTASYLAYIGGLLCTIILLPAFLPRPPPALPGSPNDAYFGTPKFPVSKSKTRSQPVNSRTKEDMTQKNRKSWMSQQTMVRTGPHYLGWAPCQHCCFTKQCFSWRKENAIPRATKLIAQGREGRTPEHSGQRVRAGTTNCPSPHTTANN